VSLIYLDPLDSQRAGTTFDGDHLTFPATSGVFGDPCAELATNAGGGNDTGWDFFIDPPIDQVTAGVFFKGNEFTDQHKPILSFWAGIQQQCMLMLRQNGRFQMEREGTFGTIALALKEDNWYYLEMSCQVFATPPNPPALPDGETSVIATVRINGTQVFTGPSASHAGYFPTINIVQLSGVVEIDPGDLFDELYITDTFEEWLGDQRVYTLRPNANGASQQWTPNTGVDHFSLIDEATPDDDTTYLESSTFTQEEMNAHENLGVAPTQISGVVVNVHAKKVADGNDSAIQIGVREGGVNRYAATQLRPGITYERFSAGFLLNPADGLPFSAADIDANEWGFRHFEI